MTRKVAVVTGTRAEYGLLQSSMERIRADDNLHLFTIATGMHLSSQYGRTVTEIRSDGIEIDREVTMLFDEDSGTAMAKSLGIGISGLAEAFRDSRPDIVLVLGDRGEAFAAALAAAHMNIPVAHIHGGDAMQGAVIDDSIRHALTKFAHVHFPATGKSATRLERLGEEPWRITPVGAPGLDDVLVGDYEDGNAVRSQLGVGEDRPLILVVQHPLTTQPDQAGNQMQKTLDAVNALEECSVVVIYPNADAGGRAMIDELESHEASEKFTTFENLPRARYLGLLEAADVMVGNSSSAVIEAPTFDLPAIDIGPRQAGREKAANIVGVPHDETAIRKAVERCLMDDEIQHQAQKGDNPYDKGGAAARIVSVLRDLTVDESLLQKELTY